MKKPLAALTFALGLSPLAPMTAAAAEYEPAYDGNRDAPYQAQPATIDATAQPAPVQYEQRSTYSEPVAVEREYDTRRPTETLVVTPDRRMWDPRHPQWGHLHGYGLFNQQGPNDFGR